MKKMIKYIIAGVLIIALGGAALASCTVNHDEQSGRGSNSDPYLKIFCFSAGNADAFAIMTENHTVILDAGLKGFGSDILSYLAAEGRNKVDLMIITHFDKDHVGGAAKVIGSIPVGTVLQSNSPKESSEYEKYVSALEGASITPITVRETYTFEFDGVKFTVDPPEEEEYENDPSNNSSLITIIECGERRLVFTGDAENERMAEFIGKGFATDCDVLKIPHHGKWDKNLRYLVSKMKPEYAIITSSVDEPEDEKTVSLLEECGVEIYYTKTEPVTVICRDGVLKISHED